MEMKSIPEPFPPELLFFISADQAGADVRFPVAVGRSMTEGMIHIPNPERGTPKQKPSF